MKENNLVLICHCGQPLKLAVDTGCVAKFLDEGQEQFRAECESCGHEYFIKAWPCDEELDEDNKDKCLLEDAHQ
jgi:DNA-directed RNA polymerase subunit RPC12/RpoP